ncbi:hypothetical protein Emed_006357 [Eimeria media]
MEQATTTVGAAPAATYTSEDTQYSADTAQWHSSYDTLAKAGNTNPTFLSKGAPPAQRESEAAADVPLLSSSLQKRQSPRGALHCRGMNNLFLMAASTVAFFFILNRLGSHQKVPSLRPLTQRPSSVQPEAQDEEKSVLTEVQEYATSIDTHALQQIPEAAKRIGLSLRYSFAAEEAAKLTRHARAVEIERTTVLLLESHLAEGRVSETQAETYAQEALWLLKEKVGALIAVARRMQMNACAKAVELAARADNALALLKAQHETVKQVKVAGGAPYLELQQYLLSRWCLAAEEDVKSMHDQLDRMKQLHHAPTNSLTEGAAELLKTDDAAKHVSFFSTQLMELTRDTDEAVKVLTQGLHVRRCLEASAAVRSLRPNACRLRVKHAKAQAAAKRLSPEGAAEIDDIGHVINQIYEAFESLEKLSASITRSKDPAAAVQDLEKIFIMRQQITKGMQGLEARLDNLVQSTEITAAEEFNVADQVLVLHHKEALTCLQAIRFLAKFGNHWGKDIQAALSKEASGKNPFVLVSVYGRQAVEAARKIAVAGQEGEQLLEDFGGAGSLIDAAEMYSRLQQHLTQVEEWTLTLVEGVAAVAACESLYRTVLRAEATIHDLAVSLDAESREGDRAPPLLPAAEDSVLMNTVMKFKSTEDLMTAGQLAVELQALARRLEAARLERNTEAVRSELRKYLTKSGGQSL